MNAQQALFRAGRLFLGAGPTSGRALGSRAAALLSSGLSVVRFAGLAYLSYLMNEKEGQDCLVLKLI